MPTIGMRGYCGPEGRRTVSTVDASMDRNACGTPGPKSTNRAWPATHRPRCRRQAREVRTCRRSFRNLLARPAELTREVAELRQPVTDRQHGLGIVDVQR